MAFKLSLIMPIKVKDQINIISTDNGRKYATSPRMSKNIDRAASCAGNTCLDRTIEIIIEAEIVITENMAPGKMLKSGIMIVAANFENKLLPAEKIIKLSL